MRTIFSGAILLTLAACAAAPTNAEHGTVEQHDDSSGGGSATLDSQTFYVDLDRLAADAEVSPDSLVLAAPDWGIKIEQKAIDKPGGYYQSELKKQLDDLRGQIHDNTGANGSGFYYVAFPYSNADKRQLAIVRSIGDEGDTSKPGGLFIRIRPDDDSDVRKAFAGGHFDFKDLVPNLADITLSRAAKDVKGKESGGADSVDLVKLSNVDFSLDGFSMDLVSGNVKSALPRGHFIADVTLFPAGGNAFEQKLLDTKKYSISVVPAGPIPIPIEASLTLEVGIGVSFSPDSEDAGPTGLTFHVNAVFDGTENGKDGQASFVGSSLTNARAATYLYVKADLALYEAVHAVAKIAAPAVYVVSSGCTGTPRIGLGFHSGFGAGLGAGALRVDWNVDGPGCMFWSNTDAGGTCAGNADGLLAALAGEACP